MKLNITIPIKDGDYSNGQWRATVTADCSILVQWLPGNSLDVMRVAEIADMSSMVVTFAEDGAGE